MSTGLRVLRLALVAGFSFAAGFGVARLPRNEVAARVNGEPISAGELHGELQKRFGPDVLRDLVHQRLILQEARKQNLKIDPSIIDRRLEEMKKQPRAQAMLKAGQTTESDLRRNLSTLVPLDTLVQSQLTVEEEIDYLKRHQDEMESVTVQHILLLDPAEADRVYAEARQPKADFAALAKKHSLDSRTKNQGGLLGEIHRGEVGPEVADVLFALKPGEVAPPVPGEDGIHLFRVVKSKTGLEELRPEIRERLISARRGDYLEELRAGAKIETVAPYRLPAALSDGEAGEPDH